MLCSSVEKCTFEKYCVEHFNDGHCDKACNTSGCAWDGSDCADATSRSLPTTRVMNGERIAASSDSSLCGDVVLTLLVPTPVFMLGVKRFQMSLSSMLHAVSHHAHVMDVMRTHVGNALNDDDEPISDLLLPVPTVSIAIYDSEE